MQHRDGSPIAIRFAGGHYDGGVFISYTWMKAKHVPECDLAYQKVRIEFSFSTYVYSSLSLVYSRIPLGRLVVGYVYLKGG